MIIFLLNSLIKCMGVQENRLVETVLLSTHKICFRLEIRKLIFIIYSGTIMENVASLNISSFNKLPTIDIGEATIEVGANPCYNLYVGCSKEPSNVEYPQHIFQLRDKKNNFKSYTLENILMRMAYDSIWLWPGNATNTDHIQHATTKLAKA